MVKSEKDSVIGKHIHLARRYTRSIEISRDISDPNSLDGYILTPAARDSLRRLVSAFSPGSTHRAFRITGPYGAGKSAFGLFLAKLFLEKIDKRGAAGKLLKKEEPSLANAFNKTENYYPIIINGYRGNIADAILDAVIENIEAISGRGRAPDVLKRAKKFKIQKEKNNGNDIDVLPLVSEFSSYLKARGKADGLLVLIDEMGRFLEYAVLHPSKVDSSIFQALAEGSAGSSDAPVSTIGFLHHRFADYAANLGIDYELEWTRSAERYEEIPFQDSSEHFTHLVGEALVHTSKTSIDKQVSKHSVKLFSTAKTNGLFGTLDASSSSFEKLYPLHPSVILSLSALARTFGQHERSVFNFLQSSENGGFQEFIHSNPYAPNSWYRLDNLADYILTHMDWFPRTGDRARRIQHFSDLLLSSGGLTEMQQSVLKAVGVISILPVVPGLKANCQALSFALADKDNAADVQKGLDELVKKGLIYKRPHSGDYCLWANSSVDLEEWWDKAKQNVSEKILISELLKTLPPSRPLVAHRHYHQFGTLRAFDVQLFSSEALPKELEPRHGCDGLICVIGLSPNDDEDRVIKQVKANKNLAKAASLVCWRRIPRLAIELADELRTWQWINDNCSDLRVDDLARREIEERIRASSEGLTSLLMPFSDSMFESDVDDLSWMHGTKKVPIASHAELSVFLSDICDGQFTRSPIIKNELVNRAKLSAPASSARLRLIERMISDVECENLNIDKMPAEKAIYLSLFKAPGVHHVNKDGVWAFSPPEKKNDPFKWRPLWDGVAQFLETKERVSIAEFLAFIEAEPFGLRSGVSILYVAYFLLANKHNVALLERGSFVPEISGAHFMRLIKNAANFELRYVGGQKASLGSLELLARDCVLWQEGDKPSPSAVDIAEHIYKWFEKLPVFSKKTERLSKRTRAVRECLVKATEPLQLLHVDLPASCGLSDRVSNTPSSKKDAVKFVEVLNVCFSELDDALPGLEAQVRKEILEAFDAPNVSAVRERMHKEYTPNIERMTDYALRSVVIRSSDDTRDESAWLRSMASVITGRTMENWGDDELDNFVFEIRATGKRLARWLATVREQVAEAVPVVSIHLVSISGEEEAFVVNPDTPLASKSEELAEKVRKLLKGRKDTEKVLGKLLAEHISKNTPQRVKDGQE